MKALVSSEAGVVGVLGRYRGVRSVDGQWLAVKSDDQVLMALSTCTDVVEYTVSGRAEALETLDRYWRLDRARKLLSLLAETHLSEARRDQAKGALSELVLGTPFEDFLRQELKDTKLGVFTPLQAPAVSVTPVARAPKIKQSAEGQVLRALKPQKNRLAVILAAGLNNIDATRVLTEIRQLMSDKGVSKYKVQPGHLLRLAFGRVRPTYEYFFDIELIATSLIHANLQSELMNIAGVKRVRIGPFLRRPKRMRSRSEKQYSQKRPSSLTRRMGRGLIEYGPHLRNEGD